jgi:signal transduction histidine kinase
LFSGLFAVTLVILIFTGALYWQKKQNAAKLSKLNQEISYINQHLDELVQRRTDVIQRQKQQIERFAFMNAHEIRGPVATILGLVNIIVQEDLLRDNKEVEQHLQMTVQKMDKIVNHVQQTLDNEDWKNIDLPPVQ